MMIDKRHVCVLMGGVSDEREVSLQSGKACAKALRDLGHQVSELDVGGDVSDKLGSIKPEVCFNALHGPYGEDGCIQGLLEILQIPYTHSGVLASAVGMNKLVTKKVLSQEGMPFASDKVVVRAEAALGHLMSPPYVLKPISDGSSVGIFVVGEDALAPPGEAILAAGDEQDELLMEAFVPGLELTCAVLGDRALDVLEIRPCGGHEFYDYGAKYELGGSEHILPADISSDLYQSIQKWTLIAHRTLGCRGVSRSDFRYDPENERLIFLEVNTQPGMTQTSLVPEMAAHAGWNFEELVNFLVEDASCNR